MTAVQIIKDAREIIKKGWCKNILAVDGHGSSVDPGDPTAAQHCILGAFLAVGYGDLHNQIEKRLIDHLPTKWLSEQKRRTWDMSTVVDYNNDPNVAKEDILALLDHAARPVV